MNKLFYTFLCFLCIGCTAFSGPNTGQPQHSIPKCIGDLDANGIVSASEAQAVAIMKYSSVRPDILIVDGTEYPPATILRSVDCDNDGIIGDAEFSKVVLNRSYGCTRVEDVQ